MEKNRKTALLELIQQAFEAENAFILGLAQEEKEKAGSLETWSAKDTLAHIAAWKQRMASSLQSNGEESSQEWSDDLDHQNATIYAEYAGKSWEQVQDFAAGAYRSLANELTRMEADRLERLDILPWQQGRPLWRLIVTEGYSHPFIHLAEYHRNKGDVSRAAGILDKMARLCLDLDESPVWRGTVHYNLACSYALLGKKQHAIQELELSLQLNPSLREWSLQDTDLDALRDAPGYQALYPPEP